MVVRRSLSGFWLILQLGVPYLAVLQLRRFFPKLARRWLTRLHPYGARVVHAYIVRWGALTIKVGQYLASRPDILPTAYIDELASLRDQVPPRQFADLQPQLDHAYEGKMGEHLARIEPSPLASASFGQVHEATTIDGRRVAVKIQYPGLAESVRIDLRLVRTIVRLLKPYFPGWPLDMIVEEIARTSREEQDYLYEGQSADRLREAMAQIGIGIPEVIWPHTREKVLVMQFAPGECLAQIPLNQLSKEDKEHIAHTLTDGFLDQLLRQRFFHADPHSGNVFLDRAQSPPKLWLLDFGMTGTLSSKESELYGRFLSCLQRDDTDGMIDVLAKLGFVLPGADREKLKALARELYAELGQLNARTFKGSQRQADLGLKINKFMREMHGISFPRHTLMLSRAVGLIEGQCIDLVPEKSFLDLVRPRLKSFLGPRAQLSWAWEQAKDLYQDIRNLPDQVAAIAQQTQNLAEQRTTDPRLLPALVFIAALLLPQSEWQQWAAIITGLALGLAIIKHR